MKFEPLEVNERYLAIGDLIAEKSQVSWSTTFLDTGYSSPVGNAAIVTLGRTYSWMSEDESAQNTIFLEIAM